jgi:hypothetical protein
VASSDPDLASVPAAFSFISMAHRSDRDGDRDELAIQRRPVRGLIGGEGIGWEGKAGDQDII